MNGGGNDFSYSGNLTFNGTNLEVGGTAGIATRLRIGTANNLRTLEVGSASAAGAILARFDQTGTDENAYSIVDISQTTATGSLAMLRFINSTDAWSIGVDGASGDIFAISNSNSTSFTNSLFVIDGIGNVGIGTTTPSERLTVAGTIQATNLLGGVIDLETDAFGNIIRGASDERLKQNIVSIENPLEIILGLRGVRYEWIDAERFGSQVEVGFIAQEVEEILPEVVRQGGEYWSLRTANIVAVVVEAIKELWTQLRGTQTEVEALRERVEELEERLQLSAPVSAPATQPEPVPSASDDESPVEDDTEEEEVDELESVPEEPVVAESTPEDSNNTVEEEI